MDDDFDRAARKHRLQQRRGAAQVHQRRRQEAAEQQVAISAAASAGGASSSSSASSMSPSLDFKARVAAKFQELVANGEAPNEAAVRAIALVRESNAVAAPQEGATARQAETHVVETAPCSEGPFTCFICVETKGADERFLPHQCSVTPERLCCKPCYVAWIESQIDAEAASVKCCHCDLQLEANELAWLVDPDHMAKYSDVRLQRLLKQDPSFIWCSKCTGGGWVDPSQPTSKCGWVCPVCSNSFVYCRFCRREHGSLTCKRFQQLRHEIAAGRAAGKDKASEGLVQRNSKMCPSCRMPIQKDGGCNFMDCPNCRRHFCWSCGRVLKDSHQSHDCDAGFEGSEVISRTPSGQACVELTRLFTNVLDIDNIEVMNTDEVDLADLRDMLVPGLSPEPRAPLFVGPSSCDGELLVRLPFNFRKAMNWELTHILVQATHPPAPHSCPPRSVALLPNVTSAQFNDFDDPSITAIDTLDMGSGIFLVPLEQFRCKGTFRRVTSLALRFSALSSPSPEDANPDIQVYFNGLALFGLPGENASGAGHGRNSMMDERANLIVSPVLGRKRWGEAEATTEATEATE